MHLKILCKTFYLGANLATPFFVTWTPPLRTRIPPQSYSDTPSGNIDFPPPARPIYLPRDLLIYLCRDLRIETTMN